MNGYNRWLATALTTFLASAGITTAELDFNRDVRPILSDKCTHCHGPDSKNRKAKLRLDTREGATQKHKWGQAVVPGKPESSVLIEKILAKDPNERMPPPESHLTLSDREKEILQTWIKEGAEYDIHWAFKLPKKPTPPTAKRATLKNPIDNFVAARLQQDGLTQSQEADKRTLLRRVTLDLTGLPPTPAEIQAFLNDSSPNAYEKVVDGLLSRDTYGEHMTLSWLDAARYADTDGYQNDAGRTMWPWRDWVIRAYNKNMPFDQFTIEQLAGDMLENPSVDQRLATGFNRNHRINNEGGALPEEFIVEYVADRAETTGAVWLGLTVSCARCHDHKYDPILQKDYFQLFAYFNGINEQGKDKGATARPTMQVPIDPNHPAVMTAKERIKVAEEAHANLNADLSKLQKAWETHLNTPAEWKKLPLAADGESGSCTIEGAMTSIRIQPTQATQKLPDPLNLVISPPGADKVSGRYVRIDIPAQKKKKFYLGLAEVQVFESGVNVALKGKAKQSSTGYGGLPAKAIDGNTDPIFGKGSITHTNEEKNPWWELDLGSVRNVTDIAVWNRNENLHGRLNGARIQLLDAKRKPVWTATIKKAKPNDQRFSLSGVQSFQLVAKAQADGSTVYTLPKRTKVTADDVLTVSAKPALGTYEFVDSSAASEKAKLPKAIAKILATPSAKRTAAQSKSIAAHYAKVSPELAEAGTEVKKAKDALAAAQKKNSVTVMVMDEMETARPTYLLDRGQYDKPDKSETLKPDVPISLSPDLKARPRNRLELAKWFVSADNPLTARVTVNRYWQKYFGTGLVKTAEDFGTQGEWPSHPELLDWLAVTFQESGWDVKGIQKLIVTSATYRQSSKATSTLIAKDPKNRLLARGPRFRLSGPAIRDQALAVSGLMNTKIGGPPVKPYQPAGLWSSVAGGASSRYTQDKGDKLYRRSMYTYWKRAIAPPRMTIFDSPGRDMCNLSARVTNTPLQALVLMNDVTFVEAARVMAQRMLTEGGDSPEERIAFAYELATAAAPSPKTIQILGDSLDSYLTHYKTRPEAAQALVSTGESKRPDNLRPDEHAAYVAVANTILNLDKFVTKE